MILIINLDYLHVYVCLFHTFIYFTYALLNLMIQIISNFDLCKFNCAVYKKKIYIKIFLIISRCIAIKSTNVLMHNSIAKWHNDNEFVAH